VGRGAGGGERGRARPVLRPGRPLAAAGAGAVALARSVRPAGAHHSPVPLPDGERPGRGAGRSRAGAGRRPGGRRAGARRAAEAAGEGTDFRRAGDRRRGNGGALSRRTRRGRPVGQPACRGGVHPPVYRRGADRRGGAGVAAHRPRVRPRAGRAGGGGSLRCRLLRVHSARGAGHRSPAAPVPGGGVGGAGTRRLRRRARPRPRGRVRGRRHERLPPEPALPPRRNRSGRRDGRVHGEREGLPGPPRGVQDGAQRPRRGGADGVQHLAGCGGPGLPGAAGRRLRHGPGRRLGRHGGPAQRLPVPAGEHPFAGRTLQGLRRGRAGGGARERGGRRRTQAAR
jgi:hypothetical protein